MSYPIVKLKPAKHTHLKNYHHSIFQNSVAGDPKVEDGGIVEVQASDGEFLCYATWNKKAYISGRAISFEKGDPMKSLERQMEDSIRMRKTFFKDEDTTAFRLINAEGDGIPGLVVDQYADVLAVQFTTLGINKLKPWVCDTLKRIVKPKGIFEKSAGPGRKKEGLEPVEGWIGTKGPDSVNIKERGLKYIITLEGSQKTGLFLDQREMRSLVRQLAKGRTVLDCCSYVGGFSLNALMGGALFADAVDYDKAAIARAKEHMQINGVKASSFAGYSEDVFAFLRRDTFPHPYDFIILDPPAFAKRSTDIDQAKHAYTDLNRMALESLPSGGLLLTCSCSYQMDPQLFQTVVFHAARQAKRSVRIIQRHRHAFDHPVNLYHPETEYLKSLLLWIE
jgi:23S rRNA (cytosine1962-C5)-methyltransferase